MCLTHILHLECTQMNVSIGWILYIVCFIMWNVWVVFTNSLRKSNLAFSINSIPNEYLKTVSISMCCACTLWKMSFLYDDLSSICTQSSMVNQIAIRFVFMMLHSKKKKIFMINLIIWFLKSRWKMWFTPVHLIWF